MFGRRTVSAIAVVAAVGAGGVVGALIGIPGSSGASTSATTEKSTDGQKPADAEKGPRFGARFGPALGADKDVLDAGAKALHLSTADLLKKLSDGKTTIADIAKDQKVNVQDVIDAMAAVAKSDISNLVNNPFPVPPAFPNFKGGPLGPDVIGPGFGFGGGMRDDTLGAAAKALGITEKELLADLGNGQSIADVAKAKHISADTVIGAMVTDEQSQIDAAVKAKHLTQDQATKLESNLKDRITNLVNNTRPVGPGKFGRGFRSGGPGGFGPGGFGPGGPGGSPNAAPAAGASTS